LEEIRVDLDRRAFKRKRGKLGFANPNAPNRKEEKMVGVLGWVGSLGLQKQVSDHFFVLSRKTYLMDDTSTMAVVWL